MSSDSPNFERRQNAIKAVRRHVRRMEIEAHRVKAHLARLEAENEDDYADELSRSLSRNPPNKSRVDAPHLDAVPRPASEVTKPNLLPIAQKPVEKSPFHKNKPARPITNAVAVQMDSQPLLPKLEQQAAAPQIEANDTTNDRNSDDVKKRRRTATYRQTAPPIMFSLAVHAIGLVLCMMFGFVTLVQQGARLFASPAEFLDEAPEEFSEVKIESTRLDDSELQNVLSETDQFNVTDNSLHEFEPSQLGMGSQPLGDVGQLDSLPSALGTLMAGAGSPGSGPPGGELGDAVFFGTRSQGNRIVFVVDNSSSMKDGRLETAVAELVRSVEALSPRQAFYVIFVSDQTYPMFFPQPAADLLPASAPNKKRLAEWLPKALLASGKNRELIKAMDLAASLRPHAVYLLWDGDMKYSEKVRTEVMTHLTRPNQWNFPIHTLGMGITSLDAEYNLTAIAQAHGGTYRRVDVPTNRGR
jgi:VWA domain-containing protein